MSGEKRRIWGRLLDGHEPLDDAIRKERFPPFRIVDNLMCLPVADSALFVRIRFASLENPKPQSLYHGASSVQMC